MDTQGLDYGSGSRHNCVKGGTVDVKERARKQWGKKSIDKKRLSPISNDSSEMYITDAFANCRAEKRGRATDSLKLCSITIACNVMLGYDM